LNSTLTSLYLELFARQPGGGGGPLDIDVYVAKDIPILNETLVKDYSSCLLRVSLLNREIDSVFQELGAESSSQVTLAKVKPDRRKLDKIIMGEILGLTREEQLEVYRAVVDLVKSRIEKAKSIQKRRGTKEGLDMDLLIKTVMENIGSETLGKFYQEKILNQKAVYSKTLPGPADDIKVEQDLYGWRLYSGRRSIECKSESEARYLKVWLEAGVRKVKIPKDKNYLKNIVSELEASKKKIDAIINSYLSSILDIKLRNRILHQLWQHLTEGGYL